LAHCLALTSEPEPACNPNPNWRNEWESHALEADATIQKLKLEATAMEMELQGMRLGLGPSTSEAVPLSHSSPVAGGNKPGGGKEAEEKKERALVLAEATITSLEVECGGLKQELKNRASSDQLERGLSAENERLREGLRRAQEASSVGMKRQTLALDEAESEAAEASHFAEGAQIREIEAVMEATDAVKRAEAAEEALRMEAGRSKAALLQMSQEWQQTQLAEVERSQVKVQQVEERERRAVRRLSQIEAERVEQGRYIQALEGEMRSMQAQLGEASRALRR